MDNLDRKHLYELVKDCVGIDLSEDDATEHKLSNYKIKMLVEASFDLGDQLRDIKSSDCHPMSNRGA